MGVREAAALIMVIDWILPCPPGEGLRASVRTRSVRRLSVALFMRKLSGVAPARETTPARDAFPQSLLLWFCCIERVCSYA